MTPPAGTANSTASLTSPLPTARDPVCADHETLGASQHGAADLRQAHAFALDLQRTLREREAAYRQLYRYVDDLHQALAERRDAREAAQSAERAKSTFLANMSHEFRTPLSSVLGFADVLLRVEQRPLERDLVTRILSAGKRLDGLINNLLAVASLEAGALANEAALVDAAQLVRETAQAHTSAAASKGLKLAVDLPAEALLPIVIDGGKLAQALDALIDNAVKFTASGSVTVVLRADPRSGLPQEICVADTGAGIDPQFRARLFSRFAQADDSSTRAHDGAGIGLHLTKSLLTVLGCELVCDSTPGAGTVFTIRLPLAGAPLFAAGSGTPAPL